MNVLATTGVEPTRLLDLRPALTGGAVIQRRRGKGWLKSEVDAQAVALLGTNATVFQTVALLGVLAHHPLQLMQSPGVSVMVQRLQELGHIDPSLGVDVQADSLGAVTQDIGKYSGHAPMNSGPSWAALPQPLIQDLVDLVFF
jgi:hypothetical protein